MPAPFGKERRFRGSIYFDIWVLETGDLEMDRLEAIRIAGEFASLRPNARVGDVALVQCDLLNQLDRDI